MSDHAVFDALMEEFYPVWFRFHPDVALSVGVPGFENRLPAVDDDDLGALASWLENLVIALGELDFHALDPDRQLDFHLLLESARVECRELLTRNWRHLDPTRFLPVDEVFQLTLHPPSDLRATMVKLLQGVPGYLRQARAQLLELPELIAPETVTVALGEAGAGAAYLHELADSVWLKHQCRGNGEVKAACDGAIAAIEAYMDTLRHDIAPRAQGRLGCGAEYFERLLARRHFIQIPVESLRTYLEALYGDLLRTLGQRARAMGIGDDPSSVSAFLEGRPSFVGEERLRAYREESNRLRDFVRRHGFLTLPEEPFRIVERPACPRPGQCDSGYLEAPQGRGGVFFIAASSSGGSRRGEPRAEIRSHCLRQAWTGAHLLTFGGGERARTLPRRLAPSGSFAAAWDLYIRQYLTGTGYYDDEDRLAQLLYQLRALRLAILDLEVNSGSVEGAQALERMVEVEPDRSEALRRLVGLARRPSDALAGAVGWMILHQARALQVQEEDSTAGDFHDRLLSQGPVPPALLVQHLFGDALWHRVREELAV
jgi:uncharacterized protein (DUF885 family)